MSGSLFVHKVVIHRNFSWIFGKRRLEHSLTGMSAMETIASHFNELVSDFGHALPFVCLVFMSVFFFLCGVS